MLKDFRKVFGPGILFACTAIGVSHLVQSTRAGALYGFSLVGLILLTNLMKYPFFEYGSRYTIATGKNLLHGYLLRSRAWLYLYIAITLLTMFTVTSTVSFFTGSLLLNLAPIPLSPVATTMILLVLAAVLVSWGKFKALDFSLKLLASILVFSTLLAFYLLVSSQAMPTGAWKVPIQWQENSTLIFVIALMGWMPTALDLSAWNSIWTEKKMRHSGYIPSLKQVQIDFAIGYGISALLAVCFVGFGTYMFWGSSNALPDQGVAFAGKIISIFNSQFGTWAYWIIGISAFSTMLSTTITVVDGYSSALKESLELLKSGKSSVSNKNFWIIILILLGGSAILMTLLSGSLSTMVNLATILSFMVAPIIAWMNFSLVKAANISPTMRPGKIMRLLSWLGLIFLWGFALIYAYVQFF